jgi:hypothetical protein
MSRPIAEQIAIRAQELKIALLALNQALVAMLHPDLPVLQFTHALCGTPPGRDLPIEPVDPLDTKRVLSYPMAEVMAKGLNTARRGPQEPDVGGDDHSGDTLGRHAQRKQPTTPGHPPAAVRPPLPQRLRARRQPSKARTLYSWIQVSLTTSYSLSLLARIRLSTRS